MKRIANISSALSLSLAFGMGAAIAAAIDELPPELAKAYQNLESQQPVGPSVLRDFKPKKGPPWTIGYASSYAGNTWRAAAMNRLQNVLLPKYKEAGLVKNVIITQSNLNDSVQIQQMRQLVDQGVDAIFITSPNTTTLNQTIEYAYGKGVPTFSFSGYVTSPDAIGEGSNLVDGGYQAAKSIAEKIGGKGNVLLVSGIAGLTPSDSFDVGAKRALGEYSGIKLIGVVQGKWTDQVAQVEVQKFLATHPEKLDGIVLQTPSENGVLKALLQSGRPMVPISLGGEAGAACYWRSHPDWVKSGFYVWPPGDELEIVWNVMIRTLEGQGPKIQTIVRSVLPFTHGEVLAALPKNCSIDSPEFVEPPFEQWFPAKMIDAFFVHPHDPLTWKP